MVMKALFGLLIGMVIFAIFHDDWERCQETVVVPDGVEKLTKGIYDSTLQRNKEEPIFRGCQKLKSITIPGSVKEIPYESFSECFHLTTVRIEHGVKIIGRNAFSAAHSLKEISIPQSVEKIEDGAFYGVGQKTIYEKRLHSFGPKKGQEIPTPPTVDNPMTEIKIPAATKFNDFENKYLTVIRVDAEGKQRITAWKPDCKEHVVLPDDVGGIAFSAFSDDGVNLAAPRTCTCPQLKSVTIPGSIETITIGNYAFSGCQNLAVLNIGEGVKTIKTTLGDGPFEGSGLKTLTIPDSVQTIGTSVFQKAKKLNSLNLGKGIKRIENLAFHGCASLTTVEIPDSVEFMGAQCFGGDTSLKEIKTGNWVEHQVIGKDARPPVDTWKTLWIIKKKDGTQVSKEWKGEKQEL